MTHLAWHDRPGKLRRPILVMAFAGVEVTRELYRLALDEGYRFYSFGDAMLIR